MATVSKKLKRKKTLGSYPYFTVVFSMALALFVIGLFGLLMLHANRLASLVKENIEVQVYLDKDLTEPQLVRLRKTLMLKPYVIYRNNEPQVTFVSKEEGAKLFIAETGEDFTAFLGENPLRDMIVLKINPEQSDRASLRKIKADLLQVSGVFEVNYVENLIDSINSNIRKISLLLLGFSAILLVASVLLINNTVKLAMFSQRFLIRSMQLVGATGSFIQRPFLSRATWQGLSAGLLAALLLWALLQYATYELPELEVLQDNTQIFALLLGLLVIGGLIGFWSCYRAVNKYLRLSLDDLY